MPTHPRPLVRQRLLRRLCALPFTQLGCDVVRTSVRVAGVGLSGRGVWRLPGDRRLRCRLRLLWVVLGSRRSRGRRRGRKVVDVPADDPLAGHDEDVVAVGARLDEVGGNGAPGDLHG
jgi:hypothetical protein